MRQATLSTRVGENWIRDGENHCYCYWTPDGEKPLLLDAGLPDDEKKCVLLDEGRRETAATTRDGEKSLLLGHCSEKSLLLLDAGRQETTVVDARWRNPLLLDAERRETTSAGGAAINCCCWTQDGKKLLLLDEGWRKITAAGRGTARIHCC